LSEEEERIRNIAKNLPLYKTKTVNKKDDDNNSTYTVLQKRLMKGDIK